MLIPRHTLKETLALLQQVDPLPQSRFWFGSPCRLVRQIDVLVHIVLPDLVEGRLPRIAERLRRTSPRWGRTWRAW